MLKINTKKNNSKNIKNKDSLKTNYNLLSDEAKAIIARPIEKTISIAVIVGIVQIIEMAILAALGALIYFFYVGNDGDPRFYFMVIISGVIFANIFFNISRVHRIGAYRNFLLQMGKILAAWSALFTLMVILIFLFKASDSISRIWIIGWYFSGSIFLILYRLTIKTLILHWTKLGKLKRRTVIIGGGSDAESLINTIQNSKETDIELLGIFDDRIDERSPEKVAGLQKIGKVINLLTFARETRVDLIIVSLPLSAEERVLQMFKQLWVLPVDIRLSAHMSKLKFKASAYSYIGDVAVFDMADKPISDWSLVFKWVFDKITAIIAIILLFPVMIIAAIAVRLDSKGPVIFKQKRYGFNNEMIEIYKFRSMYADMSDATASKLATKNDPRITKVGKFIRKTSIDELPQLFNVLKNELSMVGPRPHAVSAKAENKLYNDSVSGYFARHKVKPGITGWAQINGWRGETETAEKIIKRVDHDLYYIDNWSLMLDVYILLMTPISLLSKNENAY